MYWTEDKVDYLYAVEVDNLQDLKKVLGNKNMVIVEKPGG